MILSRASLFWEVVSHMNFYLHILVNTIYTIFLHSARNRRKYQILFSEMQQHSLSNLKKVTDWCSFERSLNFYWGKTDVTFSLFPYLKIVFTFSALNKNAFMTETNVLEFSLSINTRNTFKWYQWPSACSELSTQMSPGGSQRPYHFSWSKVRRLMLTSEQFQTQWFQLISCFLWSRLLVFQEKQKAFSCVTGMEAEALLKVKKK